MQVLGFPARRIGNGLVAFGAIGLVLTTLMTVAWLVGLLAIRDLDERLEADRQSTAAALADAAALMATSSSALRSSADSLGSVGATLDDSARMLDSLSSATADLADALEVTILGQQPFASLAGSFDQLSVDVERVARDTRLLVTQVGQVRPDIQSAAIDLRAVEASVSALAARVSDFGAVEDLVGLVRGYGLLSALISAWLAALAAGCIWAGRQLQRAGESLSAGTIPTS
jgi:methyl-accepting chemotaxis protein